MVRSIWKTVAVGAFAWLLAPSAPAQSTQNEQSQQTQTYQQDSSSQSSSHKSSTIRRGSRQDSTQMDQGKKSHKHKSSATETKKSKKTRKHHKGSGVMEDSTGTQHRGSGIMNENEKSESPLDTSSTRHRGDMNNDRSGMGDTTNWNDRNRLNYPEGTSGGNTQQLDSIHHRGSLRDTARFNDRNNSATMDTVMGPDSSGINRRGGTIYDNADSLNRSQDSVFHRGSLDSLNNQNPYDSSSRRGGIYHRGEIRDSAGSPEMNNPDIDQSNPDMNRTHEGMHDTSKYSVPEQQQGGDSLHRPMGMGAMHQGVVLASYDYQEKNSQEKQDTNMSGSKRRGGMENESGNENMNTPSNEFSGTFKATLVNADIKAHHGEATVKVNVTGIKMVDPAEMNEKPHHGEGHIHYQIDNGPEIATTATKLSFHKLSPGDHTIKVMLAGNDHNPLGPQETLKVTVPEHGQE